MDWSRTKSIFIWVFLILNIFLYSQYLNTYNEGQTIEVLGETTKIESLLKKDNITYIALPNNIETASYYSGQIKNFLPSELPYFTNQNYHIEDDSKLIVTMEKPVKLQDTANRDAYTDFVNSYVHEGSSYVLWSVDEENHEAIFFQKVNDLTLYYNMKGYIKVFFNEDNRVFAYEQTMLEKHEKLEQRKNLITPIQVLQILYNKNILKPDSQIMKIKLGYSTIVQLTQTQVFAPTWEVQVRADDNTLETHFVNAVDGKIVDIQNDLTEAGKETDIEK
jgi:regulatory protein YycI of two-component signal transduction system YycFG